MEKLFRVAVKAADPALALRQALPPANGRRAFVVGAGKASAVMAGEFCQQWDGPVSGAVAAPKGSILACDRVRIFPASHPVPDRNGLKAAEWLMNSVAGLGSEDLVVALVSGGGSAMLPLPPEGFALSDEVALNHVLLKSGAPISAVNAVRKQFSRIKGGRLAAACHPARVETFLISDVPGDDPAQVASGPTVPDRTTILDAITLVNRYRIRIADHVLDYLRSGRDPAPDPRENQFRQDKVHIMASARQSLEESARVAREAGVKTEILSDAIEGEARIAGRIFGRIVREIALRNRPFRKPVLLLSGGETTVTVSGTGKGGRNGEFLLALAIEIEGLQNVAAMAADTDGIDGTGSNAGAFADGTTASAIRRTGHDPEDLLANNDALAAFKIANGVFTSGATGTNVNDFRAVLIG